jgi:hypothetical protein
LKLKGVLESMEAEPQSQMKEGGEGVYVPDSQKLAFSHTGRQVRVTPSNTVFSRVTLEPRQGHLSHPTKLVSRVLMDEKCISWVVRSQE